MVGIAAAVLALSAGSKPLFVSASASAALEQDLEQGCAFDVGLRVQREGTVDGVPRPPLTYRSQPPVALDEATAALDRATGGIRGLRRGVITVYGGAADVVTPRSSRVNGGVQLVARTNAEKYIDVIDSVPRRGVWLPDTTATAVGARAGQEIDLSFGARSVRLPVQGVFRDLSKRRGAFWCSMEDSFEESFPLTPPPVALLDQELLLDTLRRGNVPDVGVWWEYAPSREGWSRTRATSSVAALTAVATSTNNDLLPLGRLLRPGRTSVDQTSTVQHAEQAAATVNASSGPVSLGAAGVSLLVLVVAARTWMDRRRREIVALSLRGAGPMLLAAKGALEMAAPLAIGATVGMLSAVVVVRNVAPSPLVERNAVLGGLALVAGALAVALGAVAVVVVLGVRRVGHVQPENTSHGLVLWEPLALVLAGAALYELRTRGSSVVSGTRVDSLALLFPILLLAGGAGLLSRLALNRRLLGRGGGWPVPPWLGLRRISAGRLRAAPVITGTAVSIGILLFATATSSSLRATVRAKALLGPGTAQLFLLDHPAPAALDASLAPTSTAVTRTAEDTVVVEGHSPADVLGIDPETFARAAFWDGTFSDEPLQSLLDRFRGSRRGRSVPAIAVGEGLPDRFTLSLPRPDGTVRVRVHVLARPRAFPGFGFNSRRPLVVVDRRALNERGVVNRPELWVDRDAESADARVRAAGFGVIGRVRSMERAEQASLEPQLWALRYLEIIGLAAGIVTVSGLGLYFASDASRRRAGTALARRMGLTASSAITATFLEAGGMLAGGLVLGAGLSWMAVRLVVRYLDPLPGAPPALILRFEIVTLALSVAAVTVTAVIAALIVERRATSAPLPEVLHDGG